MEQHHLPVEALVVEKKLVLLATTDDELFSLFQKIFDQDDRVSLGGRAMAGMSWSGARKDGGIC